MNPKKCFLHFSISGDIVSFDHEKSCKLKLHAQCLRQTRHNDKYLMHDSKAYLASEVSSPTFEAHYIIYYYYYFFFLCLKEIRIVWSNHWCSRRTYAHSGAFRNRVTLLLLFWFCRKTRRTKVECHHCFFFFLHSCMTLFSIFHPSLPCKMRDRRV